MTTAHQGMGITAADFDALVEDLVGALDKFKVGAAEKTQLLGVLWSDAGRYRGDALGQSEVATLPQQHGDARREDDDGRAAQARETVQFL